jgi:hypothetical protein
MQRCFLAALLILLTVGSTAAVEVPFRDGSVVEAAGYTVNGSYIMIEMADGSRLAYDVGDIDLDALQQAEAEAAAAQPASEADEEGPTTMGVTSSLQVPDGEEPSGLTITDQHVKHVRGSGIAGPEDDSEAEEAADDALPEGYQEGGNVLLNNVAVSPLEGGQWEVKGEVLNRTQDTVLDVVVNMQAAVAEGEDPWTAEVPVSGALGPDEKAVFSHTFSTPDAAAEGWTPALRVKVIWMQNETRLEPNYNRTAPHPSALPLDRGGVGGVDTREDIED